MNEIYEVVKAAYIVELGDSGVAFKNTDRYTSTKSLIEDLPFFWVLRTNKKIEGCVKAKVDKDTQIVEIGPLAVRPECQVCFAQIKYCALVCISPPKLYLK